MPSEKTVIALRLADELHEAVKQIAKDEHRSIANAAEILLRMGLNEFNERCKASGRLTWPRISECKLCGSKHWGPERGPQCALPDEPRRD